MFRRSRATTLAPSKPTVLSNFLHGETHVSPTPFLSAHGNRSKTKKAPKGFLKLFCYFDSHVSGAAFDDFHCCLHRGGIQINHFLFGNLAHLGLRYLSNLHRVRRC